MIRTQVYIPNDLYYQAKSQAQRDNKSVSVILRDGLKLGLKKNRSSKIKRKLKLSELMGTVSFSDKKTNVAITHNDIYDIWSYSVTRIFFLQA